VSKSPATKDSQMAIELSFEQALASLELVIRDLEDGRLGLNESLGRYEEGVRLLKHCHETLNQAERKILLLTGLDENGQALTEPFQDEAMTLEQKKDHRSRRRSGSMSSGPAERSTPEDLAVGAPDELADGENCDVDRQKGLF